MKNCHNIDGTVSCLASHGQTASWEQCEKACNSKFMRIFGLASLLKSIATILSSEILLVNISKNALIKGDFLKFVSILNHTDFFTLGSLSQNSS